jgi:hypothetical protein
MSLVTLADAKDQLNTRTSGDVDDTELQRYVDAVTKPMEDAAGRVLDPRTFTDIVQVTIASGLLLARAPVTAVTAVVTTDGVTSWDPANLFVDPDSGMVTVQSGPALNGQVAITYTAGVTPVAAHVELAALITIQHLWETKRGTMGVTLGGEGETFVPRGFAVPRRATELLGTPLPGVA